jgi:hypothetical protein
MFVYDWAEGVSMSKAVCASFKDQSKNEECAQQNSIPRRNTNPIQ